MDSGTHLVIGLGLAGLSYIDPVVAADSTIASAVLIGTVIGSQVPDIDGLMRLKGNGAYIRCHRGFSHSLPAVAVWILLITGMLSLAFGPVLPLAHILLWVSIAVCFHVFTDLFNTYGTQALRPFSEKWVAWNIIHIFDPVIFTTHFIAIFMWSVHIARPGIIFPALYILLAFYYAWRTIVHYLAEKRLPLQDKKHAAGDRYYLIPTFHLSYWNVVKKKASGSYSLGELRNNRLTWIHEARCAEHPAIEASKQHPDIASFLYFTSFACAEYREHSWGYEVRWADVRYRHRKQYPFVGVLLMDHNFQFLDSYVGWLNETKIEKKLGVDTN